MKANNTVKYFMLAYYLIDHTTGAIFERLRDSKAWQMVGDANIGARLIKSGAGHTVANNVMFK